MDQRCRCPEVGGFEALAETGIDRLEKAARVILAPGRAATGQGSSRPAFPRMGILADRPSRGFLEVIFRPRQSESDRAQLTLDPRSPTRTSFPHLGPIGRALPRSLRDPRRTAGEHRGL
jgi:hypothetical protein